MRGLGSTVAATLVLLVLAAPAAAAEVEFGDGGWCWFQDPRAITHTGEHSRSYIGWVSRDGHIVVGSYDHDTRHTTSFVLHANLERDDHVSPALHMRPDGRITAFYAKHSEAPLYYRTTENPEDVTSWGPEQTITTNTPGIYGYTYPNPIRLAAEKKTYLFWRGGNLDPTFSTQADGAAGWASSQRLMNVPNDGASPEAERPYVKYASDGNDTIHFAYTNAHPAEAPDVNIYYGRIRDGVIERADGSDMSALGTPITPTDAEEVHDASGPTWIHDVALGTDGNPVVVFASFPSKSSATDHVYHYARWTGTEWDVRVVTPAGGSMSPERSPLYSGGITLDQQDPSSLYLSRQIGDTWSVEVWNTPDHGLNWAARTLAQSTTEKTVRPLSPRGNEPNGEMVLWMTGPYGRFLNFDTTLTSFVEDPPTPSESPPAQSPSAQSTPGEESSGSAETDPPEPGEPSEATPPEIADPRTARVRLGAATTLVGRRGIGRLRIRCTATAGDRCRIAGTLRHRRARIGSVRGVVRGGRLGTVRVRLDRRGLVRLRRARTLRAVLVARSASLSGRSSRVGGPVRLRLAR